MNTEDYRIVDTPIGWVECPRHINRIDSSCQGWQVRFQRAGEPYFSRLFSDGVHGGILTALNEAEKCLEAQQANRKRTDQLNAGESNHVCFSWNRHSKRKNIWQLTCMVHICSWKKKKKTKSFFVCTEETYSEERIAKITAHAEQLIEWKKKMISEIGREQLMETPIPEHLNHYQSEV